MTAEDRWPFEVVVAAYGESPFLKETLDSLLVALPDPGPRITVLDDASPTDAVARIAQLAAPRVRYRRNEANLGVSGAFNVAMDISESEYTILVGPDDRMVRGAADVYKRAIERFAGAAAIQPAVSVIDEHGQPCRPVGDRVKAVLTPDPGRHAGESLAVSLLRGNWTYNPSLAWRTDIVREHRFGQDLHTAMDLDLLLRLTFAGEVLGLTDEPALEYRRHGGAVSSGNRGMKRLREELQIQESARRRAQSLQWRRAARAAEVAATARLHGLMLVGQGPGWSWQERWDLARLALGPTSRA